MLPLHPKGSSRARRGFLGGWGWSHWQRDTGGSLVPSPGTGIVDDGQGRDAAVHEDLQGSIDGGGLGHDSHITEGADAQLLHCFLQEAWLGDGGALC